MAKAIKPLDAREAKLFALLIANALASDAPWTRREFVKALTVFEKLGVKFCLSRNTLVNILFQKYLGEYGDFDGDFARMSKGARAYLGEFASDVPDIKRRIAEMITAS